MNYLFNGVSLQNKRPSNMDSLLLKCGRIGKDNALLAVVCDGVGGLENGGFASSTTVKLLNEWFDGLTHSDYVGLRMRDTVLAINTFILSAAKNHLIHTASTLSALFLIDNAYYLVHIGDSRIYSYFDNTLSVLTKDDVSPSGKLTACIGQRPQIILQYAEGPATDKIFLLCSDGLYKRMDMDFLTAKISAVNKRTFKDTVDALAQFAISNNEQDNITLALIKTES